MNNKPKLSILVCLIAAFFMGCGTTDSPVSVNPSDEITVTDPTNVTTPTVSAVQKTLVSYTISKYLYTGPGNPNDNDYTNRAVFLRSADELAAICTINPQPCGVYDSGYFKDHTLIIIKITNGVVPFNVDVDELVTDENGDYHLHVTRFEAPLSQEVFGWVQIILEIDKTVDPNAELVYHETLEICDDFQERFPDPYGQ